MNIRQVRKKIKSIVNVHKITRAMQLVSAFKMKKAQAAAIEGKPYQESLKAVIKKIIAKVDKKHSKLLVSSPRSGKELLIVITSNKGLCGAFNFNLLRYLSKTVDFKKTDFIVLGKKGASLIFRLGGNILADYSSNVPLLSVSAVFELVVKQFLDGKYDSVSLFYNNFISILQQDPVKETILPVTFDFEKQELAEFMKEYLIEPSAESILEPLLMNFVEERIRRAIIQSDAGEQSARMMAMKNATENASDVIYNLTLMRNKLRQEKITNELLDMITAKESVEAG